MIQSRGFLAGQSVFDLRPQVILLVFEFGGINGDWRAHSAMSLVVAQDFQNLIRDVDGL